MTLCEYTIRQSLLIHKQLMKILLKLPLLKQHTGDHYIIYVANIGAEVVGYLALSPYRFG